MDIFLITSIVAYSGYIFGGILAYFVQEEFKLIKRVLIIAQKIIFILISAFIASFFNVNLWVMLTIAILSLLTLLLRPKLQSKLIYFPLGILYFFSATEKSNLLILSSLIFLFGIPSGTVDRITEDYKFKEGAVGDIIINALFLTCIILYLLNRYFFII